MSDAPLIPVVLRVKIGSAYVSRVADYFAVPRCGDLISLEFPVGTVRSVWWHWCVPVVHVDADVTGRRAEERERRMYEKFGWGHRSSLDLAMELKNRRELAVDKR